LIADFDVHGTMLKNVFGCDGEKCAILEKGKSKYKFSDNGATLTVDGIKKFLNDANEDLLTVKWTKSEAVPANPIENNVRVLVGSNFEQEVRGKNVFVMFHMPTCKHCTELMPAVENLKKVLKREDVIIAKFNVRGNDCSHPMINTQKVPKL